MRIHFFKLILVFGFILIFAERHVEPVLSSFTDAPFLNMSVREATISVDDARIAWISYDNSVGDTLYISNLDSAKPVSIYTEAPRNYFSVSSAGDFVVWTRGSSCGKCSDFGIFAKNIISGEVFKVSDGLRPVISGDWVVWEEIVELQGRKLVARNIRIMSSAVVLFQNDRPNSLINFQIDNERIVWIDSNSQTKQWNIYTILVGENKATLLAQGLGLGGLSDFRNDIIVYTIDQRLNVYNLKTKTNRIIADTAWYPTTNGRYIFWEGP